MTTPYVGYEDMHPALTLPISPDRDHLQGPLEAPVALLEYGDYECPFCGQAHVVVQALCSAMGDDLLFAFRNFPLRNIHPHAEHAAEAAEAAGAQGKFWPMHDLLFENQAALEDVHLLEYAAALGLDVATFARDVASKKFAPKVQEDFLSGVRSGVNGTPTFFINGVRHDGGNDFESLLAALRLEQLAARR